MLQVEIRVEGQFDPKWDEWLGWLSVTHPKNLGPSLRDVSKTRQSCTV
jgi:hypothetical protein